MEREKSELESKDESGYNEEKMDKNVNTGVGNGLPLTGLNNILFSKRSKKKKVK